MAEALLATRTGSLTPGLEEIVSALGYTVAGTFVADGSADNRYHLPPGLVEELGDELAKADVAYLAIDGLVHEGQMVDLAEALGPVTIRDRQGVVWEHLADGGNETAQTRLQLRKRRIERRQAIRAQRTDATDGPSGTSGAVTELEADCERLEERLAAQQDSQRRQVTESYKRVDAQVTVVGTVEAPTSECWAGIVSESGTDSLLRPATPNTAITEVGSYELAVTETPGLVDGGAEWFADGVPGTVAAVERADVALAVGDTGRDTIGNLTDGFEGTVVQAPLPDAAEREAEPWTEEMDEELRAVLPTARLVVRLPYSDEARSLVSSLYEQTTVEDIEYGNEIRLVIETPEPSVGELQRQIEEMGWTSEPSC